MEPYMYIYVVEWKYASHAVFELSQVFCFCFFFDGLNHFTVVGPNQSSDEEENSSSDDDEINDKVGTFMHVLVTCISCFSFSEDTLEIT